MESWRGNRLIEHLGIELPIIQAPMAGASGVEMALAVSAAGGLGSLPCGMLDAAGARAEMGIMRERSDKPFNSNFFCHTLPAADPARERTWRKLLAPYYAEFGLDPGAATGGATRNPFDAAMCEVVEEFTPQVVSFHFGLPEPSLLDRVKATGAAVMSSATTVAEARWLADHGCDVVIAQGSEAGGHRGMFLSDEVAAQPGTFALVPQVVDAIDLPVVAAGGIADGRGIAAAFALGASAVQIGTAYLLTPQSLIGELHRSAVRAARDDGTTLTNVISGRPARGLVNRVIREIGPLSADAPAFPTAGAALLPLKRAAEQAGRDDFSTMWAGQAAALAREMDAAELTRLLAAEAQALLSAL